MEELHWTRYGGQGAFEWTFHAPAQYLNVFTNPVLQTMSFRGFCGIFITYTWLIKSLDIGNKLNLQSLFPPQEVGV